MISLVEPIETTDEVVELESTALTVADEARKMRVTNDAEYEAAGHYLRYDIKAVLKEIDDTFGPIKAKQHAAWKEACEQEKRHKAPLLEAEKAVKRLMGAYVQEQERKRLEEAETLEAFGAESTDLEIAKPKAEGVSIRKRWVFEIVDAGKLKPEFLVPNTAKIQKVVNALKGDAAAAVGEGAITVREDSSVAVRV